MKNEKIKILIQNLTTKFSSLKEKLYFFKSTEKLQSPKLFKVKIWDPQSLSLKTKFFVFKKELVLGSDKTADIVLPALRGFEARLQFLTEDLFSLAEDRIENCPQNEIFHIGPYSLQWTAPQLLEKSLKWALVAGVLGIFLLIYTGYSSGTFISCGADLQKLEKGHWERTLEGADEKTQNFFAGLALYRKSFKQAMDEGLLVKARGELQTIQEEISNYVDDNRAIQKCNSFAKLKEMEVEFAEALLADKFKQKKIESAAEDIVKLRTRFQNRIEVKKLVSQLMTETKALYYEGYGLTDLEPLKGKELMNRAAQVCEILGLSEQCFKKPRGAAIPAGVKDTSGN